jgi:hypothetical protein
VKKNNEFKATLLLNAEKGGAWLATWTLTNDQDDNVVTALSAWKNASAAKRWLKEAVVKNTPRKSIKMTATGAVDVKGKPSAFVGNLTYRGDK